MDFIARTVKEADPKFGRTFTIKLKGTSRFLNMFIINGEKLTVFKKLYLHTLNTVETVVNTILGKKTEVDLLRHMGPDTIQISRFSFLRKVKHSQISVANIEY